jgi:curved DNA-binding protein CbpA
MTNLYQLLGVSNHASQQEIKAAFKKLALTFHPDRNAGDTKAEERFKVINSAYQVLSDPYKRAKYDLMLNYQQFQTTTTFSDSNTTFTGTYQGQPHPRDRAYYYRRKRPAPSSTYDKEKAARESFAIGSIIILSLLVIVGVYAFITSYIDNKQLQEEALLRKVKMEKAKAYLEDKDYQSALQEVSTLIASSPGEMAYKVLREDILQELHQKANSHYQQKRFDMALPYFMVLKDYEPAFGKEYQFKLAYCFREMKRPQEAIASLKQVLTESPEDIQAFFDIGNILFHEQKHEEALNYLDMAKKIAINYYKSYYGNAYPLLVEPEKVSDLHYDIFFERAQVQFAMQNFDGALKDCSWAIFLRPSQGKTYMLKADCLFANQRNTDACSSLKKAHDLMHPEAKEKMKLYCK